MPRLFRAGRPAAATAPAMPAAKARAGILAAALLCLAAAAAPAATRWDPDPAWRQAESLPDLVARLDSWLDAESALPRRAAPPTLRLVSEAEAASLAGRPARGLGRPRGLYDPETATVYLVRPWSPRHAEDVAVLLHELVHHRQAPRHHYCAAGQEPLAYRLQERWLASHGLVLDWPRLAVILAAGCTPRDVHP